MLHLKTFGGLSVEAAGAPARGAAQQRKTLALLALLAATSRRGRSRDKLIAYLWPDADMEHGRNLLNQACYALRRDLHAPELFVGATELRLNPEIISSDFQTFEEALDRGDPEQAVAVYSGPFLDGFYVSQAGAFERWVEKERARLVQRATEALESLAARAAATGDVRGSVKWWRRLTELDPLSAHAALGLMRALDDAGEPAEALEQGQRYEAFVRQELGAEPAAEVTALIRRLRHRTDEGVRRTAEPAHSATAVPGIVARPGPPRAARFRRQLALGAALMVLAGGIVVVASSRKPAALDRELLAVAPFGILDPKLELWHEGLVDVLSRNLDGAGPFRTVSPTVVIRRWRGRADRASAEGLARRTGAGIVLFGQLSSVGADSVRVRAAVLDARDDRTLSEIDRTDAADRIDRLADSLSVDVIRTLTAMHPGIHIRRFSVGTRSLPALKAFLQGEGFFRRFALDSAIASYDRAVAIDTAFPLALRRLQWALGWNDSAGPVDYFARAGAFVQGLSPRDSLLVLSDSGFAVPVSVPSHPAFRSAALRRFAILEEAARRYPEDPEVWYQLGEVRFHAGFVVGNGWNPARAAFDRAIALDSGFAPAYIHPVEIALNDNDPDGALRYVRGYLAISSAIPEGGAMRLLGELLDPRGAGPRDLGGELERAPPVALYRLALAVESWPDAEETQIRVWPRALAIAKARFAAGDTGIYFWIPADQSRPSPLETMVPRVLIHRGHLQEARRIVENRLSVPFMELAELGAIPREMVETALDEWFHHPGEEDLSIYPWYAAGPCCRTLDAALWWAAQRDTASLRRLVRREASAARTVSPLAPANARPVPEFARAALALARGDTSAALSRFLAIPDSLCPDASRLREVRFRLLAATGRGNEAAAVFDRSHDRRVSFVLERARLAERLGDRPTAIKYYQFVAQAWRHADPELQPVAAEARTAIVRLGGKPPR